MKKLNLLNGNNIDLLKTLADNSVDSIVSDPPYGLSFMNKKWDYDVPSVDFWKEAYRVLKPGGHILSFGGTRTYHRMVIAIEDAGFEIRDQIMWIYGSGFPKSYNISKGMDAKIKTGKSNPKAINQSEMSKTDGKVVDVLQPNNGILGDKKMVTKTIGASLETEEAQEWKGWGSALKPANEPICLARKPLSENSLVENCIKWRTGGINIDGCRIGDEIIKSNGYYNLDNELNSSLRCGRATKTKDEFIGGENQGRFPANSIFECTCDEAKPIEGIDNYNDKGDIHTDPNCPCYILDEQSGVTITRPDINYKYNNTECEGNTFTNRGKYTPRNDKGGASRFFYQAKVSKAERNMGLEGFEVEILTHTIKLLLKTDYNNKNLLWEKQDLKTILVDTDKSHQKDIEEYGAQQNEDKLWNTELFGKVITDQFLMDAKSIILTATNSITIYQTLNVLIQKSIKTNIQELNGLMVSDIKLVSDVENKSIKMSITLQKKDGFYQNVNPVVLESQWSLSVKENKCSHPTLKPINLMTYLCRLVTPVDGVILDPFMGSGSTGIAALLEGFNFIGMELDNEYFKIAESRINNYEKYRKFIKK